MDLGIPRALANGVAVVALRNSHHIGRIGHWAEQCALARLVSLHFVNILGGAPVVAPFAGADARLHTNPVAIGLPRDGEQPIVLDFATSRSAQGKMRIAMNRGREVPEGYLIDADGRPSTDPGVVYRHPLGALLPFGEHKGSGLGLMCDLLAGALSGAGTLHEGTMAEGIYLNNMLSILVDPRKLAGHDTWQREVAAAGAFLKASPSRLPGQSVMLPGEPERLTRQWRESEGIPIDRTTWGLMKDAAVRVGVQLQMP
jgi:uncharacterized oxidoreductase